MPAPVVAATAEEAANLQLIRFLKGGTPPEGSGINEVFKATNELYAHVMARVGSEPNIRPLQRSTSEGSLLRSRSVPGRRLQPLGPTRPGKKRRRKAASVEDGLPSPGADLSRLRAIGASESTWHESVRRSAMESWRELQRDAPFRRSSSRLPPISRSSPSWMAAEAEAEAKAAEEARLAAEAEAEAEAAEEARLAAEEDSLDLLRMSVFSLGSGSPSTRHATQSHTRRELHWSPDGR